MDSRDNLATAIVTSICELLTEASNLTWKREKTEAVWRLTPVASIPLAPAACHWLRISPIEEEGTSEALRICVANYYLPGDFLLYIARSVYDEFGFLTEWEPDNSPAKLEPASEEEKHRWRTPQHPAEPSAKGSTPRKLWRWNRRQFLASFAASLASARAQSPSVIGM